MKRLLDLVPRNQDVIFACIGTDRCLGDSLGPITGTLLEEKGYHVIGTLEKPLHAINLEARILEMNEAFPNHFVIAIDACLGKVERIGKVFIEQGSILPGAAVNKNLPPVGDVAIKAIVNVGGFQEFTVLQNTRLHVVMELSKEIVELCDETMKHIAANPNEISWVSERKSKWKAITNILSPI